MLGQTRSALCLKNSCAGILHSIGRKALQGCCEGHSLAVKIKCYCISSRLFALKVHLCNACKLRLRDFRLTFKQLLKGNCRRKCLLPKDFSKMSCKLQVTNCAFDFPVPCTAKTNDFYGAFSILLCSPPGGISLFLLRFCFDSCSDLIPQRLRYILTVMFFQLFR